jgi:hypothetical protein
MKVIPETCRAHKIRYLRFHHAAKYINNEIQNTISGFYIHLNFFKKLMRHLHIQA